MTITYNGMTFAAKSQGAEMHAKGQLDLLTQHVKDIKKASVDLLKAVDASMGLKPFGKDDDRLLITSNMTAGDIARVLDETRKYYGKKFHGLYKTLKTEHGWFIVALFRSGDHWEHWNYHPGRKRLTLTHTTPYHTSDQLYMEFDTTLAALKRLYEEDKENA